MPSTGWGGDGLLGLTIIFCKIEDISEQAFRVLAVAENSPAAKAGLRPDADFVLGTIHGRFESLEDLRDKAVAHADKEWPLMIYDAELDTVREVALMPTPTWWPGHEGGAGVLGCEFACGIVHRLPFVVPSSEELEQRVKASMPNQSPSISVYVDPLSPNSTPGASPAPPAFFSPPRALNISSPSLPSAAPVAPPPSQAAESHPPAAVAPLSPTPASHVTLPVPASPVAAPPTANAAALDSSTASDIADSIRAIDISAVASPGRPVLKTVVVADPSVSASLDADEEARPASELTLQPPSQADPEPIVDEAQFNQEVQAVLSKKQFKTFSANMKLLSGGAQTVDVTLSNVSAMLGDRPLLQQQLRRLIKQVRGQC